MSPAPSVPELLRRGASAPASASAVDAVMGEDWAHLELGRGAAARLAIDEGRRSGARRRAAIGGVLAPNPQALVKLIGSGGTGTARGLRAQMSYLSRQGDVPLASSESTFGTELGADDAAALAAAWGLPEADRGGADRTSHFVVSFPEGTDRQAAERAGRAWAAELFDSGAYGDRWDYYTAFHTDTAYPHIHVVVGRRGLDEGIRRRRGGPSHKARRGRRRGSGASSRRDDRDLRHRRAPHRPEADPASGLGAEGRAPGRPRPPPLVTWFYVTAFVSPATGESHWYLATGVSKALFEDTLSVFAREAGAGRDRIIVLVLDGAGYHMT